MLTNGQFLLSGWYEVKPRGILSSSCELFDFKGFEGQYYFAFRIVGKNGKGFIRPRANGSDEGSWFTGSWQNTKRKFCVNIDTNMGALLPFAYFEDPKYCPTGWVFAPFPISILPAGGMETFYVDADSSAEVDSFAPRVGPDDDNSAFLSGQAAIDFAKEVNYDPIRSFVGTALIAGAVWAILNVIDDGVKPYERPASLAGLPEETQRLYDEYHLCRVRTKTFYMVPGGITDPCDEDYFAIELSLARATGQPAPIRDVTLWQGSQGVAGKYEEHPIGIVVVFDAAPEGFTPDIPDSLLARSGSPCTSCGAKDGWLVGGSIQFRLNYNVGSWDRIRSVTLSQRGYSDWSDRPWILRCDYYAGERAVREVNYWYRSMPGAAVVKRLSSLPPSLPNILGVREQCPVTLTDEIKRQL